MSARSTRAWTTFKEVDVLQDFCKNAAEVPSIQELRTQFDELHKKIHLSAEKNTDDAVSALAGHVHDVLLGEPLRILRQHTTSGTGNDDSIKPASVNGQQSSGAFYKHHLCTYRASTTYWIPFSEFPGLVVYFLEAVGTWSSV